MGARPAGDIEQGVSISALMLLYEFVNLICLGEIVFAAGAVNFIVILG
jgi:hypothetical protein